ncbi:hypothetical protein [Streptomyces sp. NPDC085937]|uniref:hypothetical protein n=1 Tax=Streptomyces sp. NPDC085937 TaxID=3365742 RepID=UPI0037D96722
MRDDRPACRSRRTDVRISPTPRRHPASAGAAYDVGCAISCDREDFEPCRPVPRRCSGEGRPTATMMVRGLADPRMKIEIEVEARRADPAG